MSNFDNLGATDTAIGIWSKDMEKTIFCWTMNEYESFYGEVIMLCITMIAFFLLIFTTNKRVKLMLSDMLPSLIFASLQCIIYPILSLLAIIRLSLQNDWYGSLVCNGFIGVMILLEVVVLVVFCIFAVSMAFRTISLEVNVLNFLAMLFSSALFNPTIEVFIRAFLPNAKSIELSIVISILLPFIYFILACLITLFRRALSTIYSALNHLFMYVIHIKVNHQNIPYEKPDNKDDDTLYI